MDPTPASDFATCTGSAGNFTSVGNDPAMIAPALVPLAVLAMAPTILSLGDMAWEYASSWLWPRQETSTEE